MAPQSKAELAAILAAERTQQAVSAAKDAAAKRAYFLKKDKDDAQLRLIMLRQLISSQTILPGK